MVSDNEGDDNDNAGAGGGLVPQAQMTDLPHEVVCMILKLVTETDYLLSIRRVCKEWHMIATKALVKNKHQFKVIQLEEMDEVQKFIETFSVPQPIYLTEFPLLLNVEINFNEIPLETVDALANGCGNRLSKLGFIIDLERSSLGIKKTKIILGKAAANVDKILISYRKYFYQSEVKETRPMNAAPELPSVFPCLKKILIKSSLNDPIPDCQLQFVEEIKARSPQMNSFNFNIRDDRDYYYEDEELVSLGQMSIRHILSGQTENWSKDDELELLGLAKKMDVENLGIKFSVGWRHEVDRKAYYTDEQFVEILSKYDLDFKKVKIHRLEFTGPFIFNWLNGQNRIVSLAIHECGNLWYKRLWMPHLKKLDISSGGLRFTRAITQDQFPNLKEVKTCSYTLNNTTFKGSFPSVEKVTIIDCYEKWSSRVQFPNIKRLILEMARTDGHNYLTGNSTWYLFAGNVPYIEGISEINFPGTNQIASIEPNPNRRLSLETMHELQELIVKDLPKKGFLALVYLTATEKIPRLKSFEMKLHFKGTIHDHYLQILKQGHESVAIKSPKLKL